MSIRYLWKNYSLSIVLAALFIASWTGQAIFQWSEFSSEAVMHGEDVKVSEYINAFLSATFENWQSEFLQLFSMVVLTSFLIHKGSKESKDSEEKMQASIDRIEQKVNKLS
ncbi:MAG TPA: DUF6766 family protein [Candidatus Kapabacteria bacterium]|nr:DUF6766 family protein [Candidatus Kapabacteria bacterium]